MSDVEVHAGNSPARFGEIIKKQAPEIAKAIGKTMDSDRFVRTVLTTIRTNPLLQSCTPESILGGVMLAAQTGLDLNGPQGLAYLVPFKNKNGQYEAQFIIGYRGMISMAYRSKLIKDLTAHLVYEADKFNYSFGTSPKIVHEPVLEIRGIVVAAYAIARLTTGGVVSTVLNLEDLDRRRDRSRSKERGPWVTDEAAMQKKSAIRDLWPMLPSSYDMAQAETIDEVVPVWNGSGLEMIEVSDEN